MNLRVSSLGRTVRYIVLQSLELLVEVIKGRRVKKGLCGATCGNVTWKGYLLHNS